MFELVWAERVFYPTNKEGWVVERTRLAFRFSLTEYDKTNLKRAG